MGRVGGGHYTAFAKHGKDGQKQRWFALELVADESLVRFDAVGHPEFDGWRWVDYWHPLSEVVAFKRDVYRSALRELAPLVIPRRFGSAR